LPHVIIGNDVCIDVSPTVVGKNHNIKISNKYTKIAEYLKHKRRALTIKTVFIQKLGAEYSQQNLATIQFTMNCPFPIQKHTD
jgi:hypothetical protein